MSPSDKRFLTPHELLYEFGFGLKWQDKWRSRKMGTARLPFIKLGGYVRYDRVQIEAWIVKHSVTND